MMIGMNRRSALTWVAAPFLLLSGCFKDEASPSGPAAGSPFVSKYVPVTREYWITTETTFKWDMVPDGESMMTKDVIHPERRYLYKTIRYVQTESSGIPIKAPEWRQLSGPIISATVGDSVVVHFRNGANTGMPLSIHPHNLVYDEANEGVWRKDRPLVWPDNGTAGGSVQPGDKFTYRWKAEEKSVGVGPYHSHSFSPAEEVSMGLIGTIIVDNPPDHPDYVKFDTTISLVFKSYLAMVSPVDTGNAHTVKKDTCSPPLIPWNGGCHPKEHVPKDQWPENIVDSMAHGGGPEVQTINGLAFANLKGLSFKKGANVRFVVFAMNDEGNQNHTAHFHGEMLREMSRRNLYKDVFDLPSAVALDLMLKAEHVGKWMLHCHVEHHAAEMMATYEITE